MWKIAIRTILKDPVSAAVEVGLAILALMVFVGLAASMFRSALGW